MTRCSVTKAATATTPDDPGGKTRYGITEAVARRLVTGVTCASCRWTSPSASRLREYWRPAGCDEWPDAIRFDVFDVAYNSGVATAIKMVQRAAFAEADGVIGPKTRVAVRRSTRCACTHASVVHACST